MSRMKLPNSRETLDAFHQYIPHHFKFRRRRRGFVGGHDNSFAPVRSQSLRSPKGGGDAETSLQLEGVQPVSGYYLCRYGGPRIHDSASSVSRTIAIQVNCRLF